jgi:hypothetical protein
MGKALPRLGTAGKNCEHFGQVKRIILMVSFAGDFDLAAAVLPELPCRNPYVLFRRLGFGPCRSSSLLRTADVPSMAGTSRGSEVLAPVDDRRRSNLPHAGARCQGPSSSRSAETATQRSAKTCKQRWPRRHKYFAVPWDLVGIGQEAGPPERSLSFSLARLPARIHGQEPCQHKRATT